jgi:hypothetical protein
MFEQTDIHIKNKIEFLIEVIIWEIYRTGAKQLHVCFSKSTITQLTFMYKDNYSLSTKLLNIDTKNLASNKWYKYNYQQSFYLLSDVINNKHFLQNFTSKSLIKVLVKNGPYDYGYLFVINSKKIEITKELIYTSNKSVKIIISDFDIGLGNSAIGQNIVYKCIRHIVKSMHTKFLLLHELDIVCGTKKCLVNVLKRSNTEKSLVFRLEGVLKRLKTTIFYLKKRSFKFANVYVYIYTSYKSGKIYCYMNKYLLRHKFFNNQINNFLKLNMPFYKNYFIVISVLTKKSNYILNKDVLLEMIFKTCSF